jgi:hypothetical protein
MTAPHVRPRQGKDLDAGVLQPEISSFRLCLAAEGKSAKSLLENWGISGCQPQGITSPRPEASQQWVAGGRSGPGHW